MYFDILILRLQCAILFQQLLLPVRGCYEQCGCVGAWAKHGVCQQRKQLENKERQFVWFDEIVKFHIPGYSGQSKDLDTKVRLMLGKILI